MGLAETARLLASLELKDGLSGPIKKATGSLGKFESKWSGVSRKVGLGLGAGAAAGAAFVGVNVNAGLESLAALESSVSSVDGAIAQVGAGWSTTGARIAEIANQIEGDIGAAFDDKDIIAGTSGLIRYGKLAESNLVPAMEVMTDLAAKTGSVEAAASLLAKALADPAKAAGKLARVGIVLTKEQQKQVKAMVEAGDVAGAQALLLGELAKSTKGAAEASQGPAQRSLSTFKDAVEDAQRGLAEGFLPVIERVRDLLSKGLADPRTMDAIRGLGRGLASGLDQVISIAQSLPWATIGDSLRIAGQGAKTVLDAFTGLPPWVQTAVITGWGLNKLSGGALSGVVTELGKGLVKGVLNTSTAVMNVKAGVVNGVGGTGTGTPSPAGGAGGIAGKIGTVAGVAGAATGGVIAAEGLKQVSDAVVEAIYAGNDDMIAEQKRLQTLTRGIAFGPLEQLRALPENISTLAGAVANLGKTQATLPKLPAGTVANDPTGFLNSGAMKTAKLLGDTHAEQMATTRAVEGVGKQQAEAIVAFRAGERTSASGLNAVRGQTSLASMTNVAATYGAARGIQATIAANRPIVTTTVEVHVTAASVTKSVTTQNRYGGSSGSRGEDRIGGP